MYTFVLSIQVLVVLVGFSIIIILGAKKPFRGQPLFLLLSVAICVQAYGYLLLITCNSLDAAVTAIKTEYFGSVFVNLLYVSFLHEYCNYKKKPLMISLLLVFNLAILGFVCTCEHHTLYYTSIEFVDSGLFPHVVLGHGPVYDIFKIQVFVMNIYVLYVLMQHYFSLSKPLRKTERYFVMSALFPCIVCPLYALGLFQEYDPSSASFIISGILILISIYRHQLFDIIHTARDNVIEAMEEGLIVVDSNYMLLDYNPTARKLFPELYDLNHLHQLENINPFLYQLFTNKIPPEFELSHHYYRIQVTKIYNYMALVGYTACIFDITENRRSMENEIQLREQAENANRAKSIFLANMSHEIRTPLNAILGLTDIVLNQKINYQVRGDISNIKVAANSLLCIINDIIDLSRIESDKMKFVQKEYKLSSVLHDVISIISVKLSQKPIVLQVETDKTLPKYFYGDANRLRQILINLMNNAVKFTDCGKIRLNVRGRIPDNNDPDNIILIFSIQDTGRGISTEDQKRIFESFEQVDMSSTHYTEGSGLGLAICQKMLAMAGGQISVVSELHKGSTFTVRLPQKISYLTHDSVSDTSLPPASASEWTASALSDHEPSNNNEEKNRYSILVVDDTPLNIQVINGLMNLFDLSITGASSGEEALAFIKQNTYDLIFLDYMMPDMDGIQTLNAIRSLDISYCKTVPVIALTANALSDSEEMFLDSGFSGYLSKPIQLTFLEQILNRWLSPNIHFNRAEQENENIEVRMKSFHFFANLYQIDWNTGLANCSGSWNSYFDTLSLFSHEGINQCKQLDLIYANMDQAKYLNQIQQLKDSLDTIGAIHLSKAASTIEKMLTEDNSVQLRPEHSGFLRDTVILCNALNEFFTSKEYEQV